MNPQAFPTLKTARITLRNIVTSDHEVILFLRSNEEVNRFIKRPANRQTKNEKDALTFIESLDTGWKDNKLIAWGISMNDDPQLIGTICLWNFSEDRRLAEVGYDLHPTFQKKGLMSEALQQVVTFGFQEKQLSTIEACTHADNEGSKKLLEKNGFVHLPDRIDIGFEHNSVFAIENKINNEGSS